MEIRAVGVAVHGALVPLLAVVAEPGDHPPQWLHAFLQVGTAAVVLKAYQGAALPLHHHVADEPASARPRVLRPHGEHPHAGQLLPLRRAVIAAQELIAAADGQERHSPVHRLPQRLSFHLRQVLGDAALLPVLGPADEH